VRALRVRSAHWTQSARTCSHAGAWEPEYEGTPRPKYFPRTCRRFQSTLSHELRSNGRIRRTGLAQIRSVSRQGAKVLQGAIETGGARGVTGVTTGLRSSWRAWRAWRLGVRYVLYSGSHAPASMPLSEAPTARLLVPTLRVGMPGGRSASGLGAGRGATARAPTQERGSQKALSNAPSACLRGPVNSPPVSGTNPNIPAADRWGSFLTPTYRATALPAKRLVRTADPSVPDMGMYLLPERR